jgi:hypothetical protein
VRFQTIGPPDGLPEIVSHGEWAPHDSIVGTWKVAYSNGGVAFIQWHQDGTEWENIDFPVLGGNLCMGSWKSENRWHYSRNHYGWVYTDGVVSGYLNSVAGTSRRIPWHVLGNSALSVIFRALRLLALRGGTCAAAHFAQ